MGDNEGPLSGIGQRPFDLEEPARPAAVQKDEIRAIESCH